MSRFSENDLLDPFDYLSDPEVVKFELCCPMTLEEVREELQQWIKSDEIVVVALKSSSRLIQKSFPSSNGTEIQ